MSVVKRISGDYDIISLNGNVSVTTPTLTVNGNLVVIGSSSKVETVDTLIYDNFITLAAGQGGGPTLNAGVEVDRGDNIKVSIRWHEESLKWQYSNDGSSFFNLGTTSADDPAPQLGGNLITGSYSITNGDDGVAIGPILDIPQIESDPTSRAGYSRLYGKLAKSGNTGLYVTNNTATADEIITKRKAFVYSLIF